MYFKYIPDIEYDTKPIKFPFSQSDYVTAKNFFRRYQVNPDVFSYSVFFKKYAIVDGERPDSLAEKAYGDPFFDWIILLVNNTINPLFDWPVSDEALRRFYEKRYEDPYGTIKQYQTFKITNSLGQEILKEGLIVDEKFYNTPFTYWDGSLSITVPGNKVCYPVSIFDDATIQNEKKREIYLLKVEYVDRFVADFKKQNIYAKSSDFISNKLKRTGV
jgi:hypothetical protein